MAERHFLDIAGLRYFARKMKESLARTQRVVKSKNFLAELDSNELAILDNSQFAYPAGQAWWINIKQKRISDNSRKAFEFIVVTGANAANINFSWYLDVKRDTTPLQPNSAYLFRMYGYGTQYQSGQLYGKTLYVVREKIG